MTNRVNIRHGITNSLGFFFIWPIYMNARIDEKCSLSVQVQLFLYTTFNKNMLFVYISNNKVILSSFVKGFSGMDTLALFCHLLT